MLHKYTEDIKESEYQQLIRIGVEAIKNTNAELDTDHLDVWVVMKDRVFNVEIEELKEILN